MENKGFLTLEKAKEQADYCFEYQEGVYEYGIEDEGCTLVEDGKVLAEGVYHVYWHEKGVYGYAMEGKGCTLVEDGKVLIEGASSAWWYAKGVYAYKIEGGDWVKINKNK